jgi:PD-(D/E)XK nuclease superfamily protein
LRKTHRWYEFEDDPRPYVSVTTFLDIINKPFLMPWAAKMERELIRKLVDLYNGDDEEIIKNILAYTDPLQPYGYKLYTEVASDWGRKIHKAIDYKLKGLKLPRMTKAERKVFDKWQEWWHAQKYELIGAEKKVRSKLYGYAGTLDAEIGDKNEWRVIIDWKTGKSAYPEHTLQNLAYQSALKEEGDVTKYGLLVYIPKEGEVYTKEVPQVTDELFQPVLDALGLWRWSNKKTWKNEES